VRAAAEKSHKYFWVTDFSPQKTKRAKPQISALRPFCFVAGENLFRIPATLLPVPLAGECCFDPLLFTWLQVKGMTLDFLDDVFGLHFALEPAQSVLERFPFLQSYFSH
jgi:hypothetical protein